VQLGRHFWFDFSYILGLRVDYLSPTLYLTDILVFLILFLWLVQRKFKLSFINYKLLFIILFFLLNCFLAANRSIALFKFLKLLELLLLGIYVSKNKFSLRSAPSALSLAVIYSSLIAIGQFFQQSAIGGWLYWLGERSFNVVTPGIAKTVWQGRLLMRPYATFSHPNSLAGFLLVCLVLTFSSFRVSSFVRILKWPVLVLGVVAIGLSFSRTAWLAGCLAVFLISRSTGAAFFFFQGQSFSQRWDLIQAVWQMIKTKPWLGVGLNNFILRLPDFWPTEAFTYWLQPVHNIFLLIAVETGLIGLAVFIYFIFKTIRQLILNSKFLILNSLFMILVTGFFDHYWLTLQQNQLLLAIVFGLAWQKKKV